MSSYIKMKFLHRLHKTIKYACTCDYTISNEYILKSQKLKIEQNRMMLAGFPCCWQVSILTN